MKRTFCMAVLLVTLSLARATEASPESIDTLLNLTNLEKTITYAQSGIGETAKANMANMFKGASSNPKAQKLIDAYAVKVEEIYRTNMSWEHMKPLYIKTYKKYFTQQEVDGMIAFFKTPVGKSMTTKMPVMMQEFTSGMPTFMAAANKQVQAETEQLIKELEKLK